MPLFYLLPALRATLLRRPGDWIFHSSRVTLSSVFDRRKPGVDGAGQERRRANRRAFPRWAADFQVRYGQGKKLADGAPREIGEGGLSFEAAEPIPLETELDIEYKIPGGQWVRLKAVVRHSQGTLIGVEFLNLRMHDRLAIVEHVSGRS